ncbi:hypothetical protein LCGC14_0725050 [marine sediment metagenome]|uniref:Uncharacterized protein n=1 Tax=marine sediment metagenome TaxID=412755 RepID=A0A0F9SWG8_9ZZZZ
MNGGLFLSCCGKTLIDLPKWCNEEDYLLESSEGPSTEYFSKCAECGAFIKMLFLRPKKVQHSPSSGLR